MKANEYLGHIVYENGDILSKNNVLIKHRLNDKGYWQVSLFYKGKKYSRRVHRILAELFIPNPENKPQVNHKDRNRANFSLDNLEWSTAKENCIHSVKNGGRNNWTRNNTGSKNGNSKLTEQDVLNIKILYTNKKFNQTELAKKFNVNLPAINKIITGQRWKHVLLTNTELEINGV